MTSLVLLFGPFPTNRTNVNNTLLDNAGVVDSLYWEFRKENGFVITTNLEETKPLLQIEVWRYSVRCLEVP